MTLLEQTVVWFSAAFTTFRRGRKSPEFRHFWNFCRETHNRSPQNESSSRKEKVSESSQKIIKFPHLEPLLSCSEPLGAEPNLTRLLGRIKGKRGYRVLGAGENIQTTEKLYIFYILKIWPLLGGQDSSLWCWRSGKISDFQPLSVFQACALLKTHRPEVSPLR